MASPVSRVMRASEITMSVIWTVLPAAQSYTSQFLPRAEVIISLVSLLRSRILLFFVSMTTNIPWLSSSQLLSPSTKVFNASVDRLLRYTSHLLSLGLFLMLSWVSSLLELLNSVNSAWLSRLSWAILLLRQMSFSSLVLLERSSSVSALELQSSLAREVAWETSSFVSPSMEQVRSVTSPRMVISCCLKV